jgi:hypothetical protein
MSRVIGITGMAPDTRLDINTDEEVTEVWGMNDAHTFLTREPACWFQIHPKDWKLNKGKPPGTYGRDQSHIDFLASLKVPVWMLEKDERIPYRHVYPRQQIVEMLGRDYLTSTMAYMAALALQEGADKIKFFGLNMADALEYYGQRPGLEYICGRLEQAGVEIWVPESCPLLTGPGYPKSEGNRRNMAHQRVVMAKQAYMTAWAKIHSLLGHYEESGHYFNSTEEDESKKLIANRMLQIRQGIEEARNELQTLFGMLREAQTWLANEGEFDIEAAELPLVHVPPELMEVFPIPEPIRELVEAK